VVPDRLVERGDRGVFLLRVRQHGLSSGPPRIARVARRRVSRRVSIVCLPGGSQRVGCSRPHTRGSRRHTRGPRRPIQGEPAPPVVRTDGAGRLLPTNYLFEHLTRWAAQA
jgi:hypothetical protein